MSDATTPRPAVFCLHALGASRREFDGVAARLDDRFDVIGLDLPGFGDLGTADGTTVDDMVGSVIRRIRRHGATRWLIVGHSMGGKIASIVAARTLAGDSGLFGLAGVVLLAASPPSPEPMDDERRDLMLSWADEGPLDAAAAREFIDANVGSPLAPADDALMLADLQRTSPEAWRAWLDRGSREDWTAEVVVSDAPALIVAGGADGDLGVDGQRAHNVPVYPRAEIVVLDGAGHLLPLERAAEVADAIAAFWTDVAGRARVIPIDYTQMLASNRVSARTRGILARRALADDPRYVPRVLDVTQLATLRLVAELVVPQGEVPIDLASRVDTQLAAGHGDGWRNADLPADPEAYRLGLDALADLVSLDTAAQKARISDVVAGSHTPARGLTADQLTLWFEDCRVDLVRQWLAHPATMARIGFDGIANGGDGIRLQGFDLLGAGEREGWEPTMEVAR